MSKVGGYLTKNAGSLKDTKLVSKSASFIRLAQYPDGTQKIQGGYMWSQGFKTGTEWMDMPITMVGMSGQEILEEHDE